MNMKLATATMVLALMLPAARLTADSDIDLPINGDFRGSPSGYCPAPGWTLTADGGQARILPTTDVNDFMLELRASSRQSQSVVSDLHQLPGYMLKLELKVQGTGSASAGYEAFDANRRVVVAADRQTVALVGYDQKIKRYFQLPAQARYVRIRLTAEPGSIAMFRDVDADVSIVAAAPAAPGAIAAPPAAPGAIAAPPAAPGTIAAPPPAQPVAAPAATPAPAAAPAPAPAPPACRLLQNDKYYRYTFLGADEHFEVSLPVGSDIDFEIGESPSSGQYWRVISYDPNICRVKIEHESKFFTDKAEIELKALFRGTTNVVLSCGGKKFTIHFTAQ